ncbi:uncharacterized protein LOC116853271 [Odontomachus brunneus]|uniref:uncharacterized protein LOC116853271 n=1 Tax=Odontomachus brunneus TaxID=486640 RepID=UPI0013F1835A|nr:uncharacterized protein LOC116853271 [Odontomachus brunneus]
MLPETPAKNVESNVTSIFSSTHETSSNAMKYLKCILSDIQGIKHDQQIIKNHLWNIKDTFEQYLIQQNHESENVLVHWTKTNNIQWPLKTKEDYDTLNNLLQNEEIRNDFMATIAFIIDSRRTLSKNVLSIIRKFLHKDLANKFTCLKPTKNKFTLQPSNFYNCIVG